MVTIFLITEIPEVRQTRMMSEMRFLNFYGYHVSAEQWINIMVLVI